MLHALRTLLHYFRSFAGAPSNDGDSATLLTNDYAVNFRRSYQQLESFDRRLKQYSGLLTHAHRRVSRKISDRDQMMHGIFNTVDVYLTVGRSVLHLIISALIANDRDPPKTILNFPCGHGREGRYLYAAFPEADIYAGDLNLDGMQFCCDAFAMKPVEANADFAELVLPTMFDVIWCGSLITHLDARRAAQLLDKFCDHLKPGGLLLFSTHGRIHAEFVHERCFKLGSDETFAQIKNGYEQTGYGYADYHGVKGLGLSLTAPSWIFDYAQSRADIVMQSFSQKAWHGLHDVSVIQKVTLDQFLYP